LRISTAGTWRRRPAAGGEFNWLLQLLWGPVAWRFSSGLAVDYNDNVRYQAQNAQGDFIFRPNVNAQMHWPVTQVNDLNLSVTADIRSTATSGFEPVIYQPGFGNFLRRLLRRFCH